MKAESGILEKDLRMTGNPQSFPLLFPVGQMVAQGMIFEMGRAEDVRFCEVIKMDIDRKDCEAGTNVNRNENFIRRR